LAWIDLDGRVTRLPIEAMAYKQIDLSPGADRALLTVGPGSGAASDVWLLDLQKLTMSRLTFKGVNSSPLWLPDGKRFIWSRTSVDGRQAIENMLVRSIDGPDSARSFARNPGLVTINGVTPDGSEVLFSEYGKVEADIWSAPVDGSRAPRVEFGGPRSQAAASVSPDGRWVSYVSDETGQNQIYVRPWRRPGSRSQISRDSGHAPMWGPDSRTLFFVSRGTMHRALLSPHGDALQADSTERLFDIDANSDSSSREIALHPSGQRFLVRIGEEENERREIGVVPGWASTLSESP
jgi:Tol biopolymer transport system component